MIRLPSNHAAITAPLVASGATFPGIPVGRSLLDGRPFHLSPVLTDTAVLPSTNSLALGGLGSGKSTTGKIRARREILHHGHQYVVIDSFGEDTAGEWSALALSLGGEVIQAGAFTLNPCSVLFPPEVREQLIRSLVAAVEPAALTPQSTHALQHALTHPKATSLTGLVDALVSPEDGRWSAAKLEVWGEDMAIALSRYTEGSLRGLFDGQDASLPPTDLPMLTFDFSRLDRNSPAIPSLMAAVSCWAEHVWLPRSTAVHRHLVLEEAWQILLAPATSELIQRLLKNSRKLGLSLDVLMHTLSDLGDGRAQDVARLCEVAHVGRLSPEEAAIVGVLLGLPDWAVAEIPGLAPGQAVWKVGPTYVDVVQTVISDDEAQLTDTSSRRRQAQKIYAEQNSTTAEEEAEEEAEVEVEVEEEAEVEGDVPIDYLLKPAAEEGEGWDWEMPPTMIDARHYDVVRAAREGRCNEAADLAVIGEREDIRSYGINSDQALSWLSTRAAVADICGSPETATQLRATVTCMGKDVEWWDREPEDAPRAEPHGAPLPPPAPDTDDAQPGRPRRRTWPYVALIAVLALTTAGVWQKADDDTEREERQQKAADYKGKSGASLTVDSVDADVIARWTKDKDRVIVELSSYFDSDAKYLRIDSSGKSAASTRGDDRYPKDPQLELPVSDPLADVTVQIEIGGATWKEGAKSTVRTVRLSPSGVAYDAETGEKLPRN
ncbi:hypothetical protein OG311_38075 (plasmid) [Streptomyces sp. NBC_01343]|uniref:hypothetical protein n=1 Tax=Streptomyces sp. NBC_01343 TaxID=2903832 RepID=UPI002E0F79F0|nr:hypothetical protein OG311_38075 [Streptomyces sp. NBC_01343]